MALGFCRSPCGERGLKCQFPNDRSQFLPSLPVRGAWIEIPAQPEIRTARVCRSPCGERGLKCYTSRKCCNTPRRSPCGERGLKCKSVITPSR